MNADFFNEDSNPWSSVRPFTDWTNPLQKCILVARSLVCNECTCVLYERSSVILKRFLLRRPEREPAGLLMPVILLVRATILHKYQVFFGHYIASSLYFVI